jgi:DNA primase
MDVAGDTATKRGINLAESQGFNIKIIDTYSGAKDPAEIILENPQNWSDSVEKARSIMDFYFDSAFAKFDKQTPSGKKEIGKIILSAIKRLQNKIEQSYWVQKLAEKLGVSQEAVLDELKSVKTENINQLAQEIKSVEMGKNNLSAEGRKKLLEDKIISLVFKDPENLNLIGENHHCLFCEKTKSFIENIKKIIPAEGSDLKASFADFSQKEEYKDFLNTLALRAEVGYEEDGCDEILLCLSELKDINIRERRSKISEELKKAEQEKDLEKVNILISEFNKIL